MKFSEAIVQFPALCGAPQPERCAWMMRAIFDFEEVDDTSVWRELEGETPEHRLEIMNLWRHFAENKAMAEYCFKLQVLTAMAHAVTEHGRQELVDKMNALAEALENEEALYPEVKAIYSVNEAVQGFWM